MAAAASVGPAAPSTAMVRQASGLNDMGFVGGLNIAQQSSAAMALDFKMPSLDLSAIHRQAAALSDRRPEPSEKSSLPPLGSKSARFAPPVHVEHALPPALQMPLFSKQAKMDEKIRGREPPPRQSGFPSAHVPSRRRIVLEINSDADPGDERQERRRRPPKRSPARASHQEPQSHHHRPPPPDHPLPAAAPGASSDDIEAAAAVDDDLDKPLPPVKLRNSARGLPLPSLVAGSLKLPRKLQERITSLRSDEDAQAAFEERMAEIFARLAPQQAAQAAAIARLPHPLANASPASQRAKRVLRVEQAHARQIDATARRERAAAVAAGGGSRVEVAAAMFPPVQPQAGMLPAAQQVPSHDAPDETEARSSRSRPPAPPPTKRPSHEEAAFMQEAKEYERQARREQKAERLARNREVTTSSTGIFDEAVQAVPAERPGAARQRKRALANAISKMM